jgi:hypothetical protein
MCHAQVEMTVDSEAVRGEGQTGFGGLLRAVCEEKPEANWTGKGEERIKWAETRCERVAEEKA